MSAGVHQLAVLAGEHLTDVLVQRGSGGEESGRSRIPRPFPPPGLGIDVVWNPRPADRHIVGWLRELLHDAATG
ncbi:hypothetical protein ACFW88_17930 [Streptomyces anandii]|uniref:LysR substrate-binding domain-containing protein n=1 Tax=Streptomyces anandii TaxID=285454 RepID=A0ABW6H7P6_9ACTN